MIFVFIFLFFFKLFFYAKDNVKTRTPWREKSKKRKKEKEKKATESPENVFICGHRLDSDLESILYLVCVSEVVPTTSS